jgi:hypothetical protein
MITIAGSRLVDTSRELTNKEHSMKDTPLPSTVDTPAIERRILRAARQLIGSPRSRFTTVYEHGHWWVQNANGDTWDAVDASGPGSFDGFSFERLA